LAHQLHLQGANGEYWDDVDCVHREIEAVRKLVEGKFPDVGVQEYHLDEWSYYIPYAGMGSQVAHFYYMDLAGLDRAAKTQPPKYLNGILLSPRTPRAAYWAWAEYAKQDGGVRLVTETNDRCLVGLASRHDESKIVRALVARAKKMAAADPPESAPHWKWGDRVPPKPPVKVRVDFEGLPLSGEVEVTILRLPSGYGPLYEDELAPLTTTTVMSVVEGKLMVELADVVEDNVLSIVIGPKGTREREKTEAVKWATAKPDGAAAKGERELHREATAKAAEAAKTGTIRIACGAALAFVRSGRQRLVRRPGV